jgi:hypothetical protein
MLGNWLVDPARWRHCVDAPRMNILDPRFKYTPAAQSTPERLREKFRRIRAEQKRISTERSEKVQPLRKAK